MSIEPLLSLLAIGVSAYAIVAQRRERQSNAFKSLIEALATSGETIEDLMKQLADLPGMKQQLASALLEIDLLKRERDEWKEGIGLLLGQLVANNIEPTWKPRDTGRLRKVTK